ncbi:MAG: hypothetical protein JWR87_2555 [Segetibacter sp.]|jgi:hypothetical protein|nr:hypothetical protein [Segetibacter sp.]
MMNLNAVAGAKIVGLMVKDKLLLQPKAGFK